MRHKLRVWRSERNTDLYKSICRRLKHALIRTEKEKTNALLNSGLKNFFNFIWSRYKNYNHIGAILDKSSTSNIYTDEDIRKAEIFSDCFSSFFTSDNGVVPVISSSKVCEELTFEPYVIEMILYKLKVRNNSSPDNFLSILPKKACTSLELPLSIIFTESFRLGVTPSYWKLAIVLPFHKKGARRSDPRIIGLSPSLLVSARSWRNVSETTLYLT